MSCADSDGENNGHRAELVKLCAESADNPFYGPRNPFYGPANPFYGPDNPFYGPRNPFYGPRNPFYGPDNSFYGRNPLSWQFATRNSLVGKCYLESEKWCSETGRTASNSDAFSVGNIWYCFFARQQHKDWLQIGFFDDWASAKPNFFCRKESCRYHFSTATICV